jgi:hypothetical protein
MGAQTLTFLNTFSGWQPHPHTYIQGFGPSLVQLVLYYNLYFDVMIHWGLQVGINCFPIAHMIWKNFLEIVHSTQRKISSISFMKFGTYSYIHVVHKLCEVPES